MVTYRTKSGSTYEVDGTKVRRIHRSAISATALQIGEGDDVRLRTTVTTPVVEFTA